MTAVIPCELNAELTRKVEEYAEALQVEAHKLGAHGLPEADFYAGVFRGAIERIRGQFSATMRDKREFVQRVLEHMQDREYIRSFSPAGSKNRFDYTVLMPTERISVIELKGCLDGNNTNIFERPTFAQEFVVWSVCSNPGADPRGNVWSGIHTRLSAEIVEQEKLVDGLIVWDWICGTIGRPCPKLVANEFRRTTVAQYKLPPPCIYLFPGTIPSVRNNPNPPPHTLDEVQFLKALHECFGGKNEEINTVRFEVANRGSDVVRTTTIERNSVTQMTSRPTPIHRR